MSPISLIPALPKTAILPLSWPYLHGGFMKAIFEIILAIIFVISAENVSTIIYKKVKVESLTKIQNGLPSLSIFTQKLTR